jgi:hypothetical protein
MRSEEREGNSNKKGGGKEVNTTIRNLVERLAAGGIPSPRIPDCVRDLCFLVAEKPSVSPSELGEGMGQRGWNDFRVDDRTLLFILLLVAETLIEADPAKRLWLEGRMGEVTGGMPISPVH